MSNEILLSVDNANDDNLNNNKNSNLKNTIINSYNNFFLIYSPYIHIFAYIYLFLPCLLTSNFFIYFFFIFKNFKNFSWNSKKRE